MVRCTDLRQEIEERVQIVQSLDALVQRGHHSVGVLCQFHAVRLFVARAQFAELLEQIKKFLMLFEQPETKEVGDEGKFSLIWGKVYYRSKRCTTCFVGGNY